MAKSFRKFYDNLPKKRRKKIEKKAQKELAKMPLAELRKARNLTQQQIAETLDVSQASVSKMEKQADNYVSTLRRYIKASGGTLHLVASFPDGRSMQIENIGEIEAR